MLNTVLPVILCGGSGTRLWPLSRSGFPKQFLVLSDNPHQYSLFQESVSRAYATLGSPIDQFPALIVTNEEHRFLALDQLRELKNIKATLLLEPSERNTAPALTLAALCAINDGDDPILLVMPADQTIQDESAFKKAIDSALQIAQSGTIAILGITPTAPETGYGYIQARETDGQMVVKRFVEKPDASTATQYLSEGGYYWNGGIFVVKASVWLAALKEFSPDILNISTKAWQSTTRDTNGHTVFIRPERDLFNTIPSNSIDYAVIEKCPGSSFSIQMVPLNAGWSDLGAWDAVWQVGSQDAQGNVTRGDVILDQTTNTLVHSSARLIGAVGVNNLVIIETADAVLVADRARTQEVKSIVNQLEHQGREQKKFHRKITRPWGWYDVLETGQNFKVKRIQLKPGASLSLQMHHHRSEHWIVVKGIAKIINGNEIFTLYENQSAFIPQGQAHRLTNPGIEFLEIIEVQSGSYLGEDDIVRFEDTYGRA